MYGDFKVLDYDNPHVFAYVKSYRGKKLLVVLNFSGEDRQFRIDSDVDLKEPKLLIGTLGKGQIEGGAVNLEPWEAVAFLD